MHSLNNLVLLVGCLTASSFLFQVQGKCDPADVVLVLDDSESIRIYNTTTDSFTFAANYSSIVRDILGGLDASTVRVSLVTYSQTAVALVRFTSDYRRINEEVDTYTREYATQSTDLGIQVAVKQFDRARDGVDKYMILFLDGTSFNPEKTREQVVEAGDSNITIISVSMRGALEESLVLAGRSYRRFHVDTPKELASRKDILHSITDIICMECKGYADVVYLLDGSDYTQRLSSDFTRIVYAPGVIDFVVDVTQKLTTDLIRKGIVLYSQTATVVANITNNKTEIFEAVRNMEPEYLNTQAGVAFKAATTLFDSATPKREYDTQRIVVYFVDGSVTNKTDLMVEAARIREKDVLVFAVGFSSAALTPDLMMATNDASNMARIPSDRQLNTFVDLFVDFLCQTPPSLTVSNAQTPPTTMTT